MRRSTFVTTLLSLCLLAPVGCAIDGAEDVAETEDELSSSRVCPQDAMQCPDGSWVGRSGPNCTFAPCPSDPTSTICQQDAMQCPDGSWVGRTGPECKFVCPTDPPPPPACWGAWLDENGLCRTPADGVYPADCCAGPKCGASQCAAGDVCCNSLSGICTKPGEVCAF